VLRGAAGEAVIRAILDNTGQYIHTNPWLALVAVFLGGMLTASNPCVLAMIPLMMSFVAGNRDNKPGLVRAFSFSLVFVFGLSLTFTALGIVAALAGTLYGEVSSVWNWLVAAVCVLMGLHLMEVLNIPIPALGTKLQPRTRGALGALLLGMLFGLVSAPCAGPILIVLLAYLAGSGASVAWGAALLLVYALGHSVLILVAGTSMGAARALIENRRANRVLEWLRRGAGVVIIAVGLYFAYRGLSS
jgi:cytochrome c-type biogenesis protein